MKSRIKKTLRNIVLTGTALASSLVLSGVSGCDSSGNLYPSSQAASGSVAAQYVATTNSGLTMPQVQGFGALGSLLGMVSQQEAMKEAAREVGPGRVRAEFISPETHPHFYNQQSQRKRKWPLIFTWDKRKGTNFNYKQIFNIGERVHMCGNLEEDFPEGTLVANKSIHLKTKKSEWHQKKDRLKKGYFINVSFGVEELIESMGEGEYENIWYVKLGEEWKEVGKCRFAVFK